MTAKIARQIIQLSSWWQRYYLLCTAWWWLRHTMEICPNQIHDSANYLFVPCNAWTPWLLPHACYVAGMVPSPTSLDAHWTFCLWQLSTSQTLWSWLWFTSQSWYCWHSLEGSCSWSHWPMANINTTWQCGILTTNLAKIAHIFEKSSDHVSTCIEHTWLSQYHKPMQVIHDNGGELTGFVFQQSLELLHIKPIPTTNKKPQTNTICKWMYQTVATLLKTFLLVQQPQSCHQATLLVDNALAYAMHALQLMVSTTLQAMPGALLSLKTCFSIFLSLLIGKPSFHRENNWSMTLCFVPTKSISVLATRLVKKFLSMTKHFIVNWNPKLLDPLTFSGSALTALWQFHCSLVLPNV